MSALTIVQICADRGIAPGSTKGAAQHLRGTAAGLITLGHQVTTYTQRRPEGPFPTDIQPLDALTADAAAGTDVIYERYSLGHRAGLELARSIGARFVLEVNAPLVDEAESHRPNTVEPHHAEVEAALIGDADLVVSVSTELTRWVMTQRVGPAVTVANGFEPAWFPQAPDRGHPPTLVFLGHPKPWHGATRLPALLVDLALAGHHPHLLIIGGGAGADQLMAEAASLRVDDQITVTGALAPDQASGMLSAATIGVAPYPRQDPFYFCPLKVIDYLAAGLPVVSTNQGDIVSLLSGAGVVVDPDDDRAFAQAVAALLDDPKRCSELGRAGRKKAMTTMTWDHAAARTVDAINSLGDLRLAV